MEPSDPTSVFAAMGSLGHEQVAFCHDAESGLRAIIAVWSTALGPSLGGTRFHAYEDERAALADVLRLSRAMGYKSAAAGLDLGGGKAVILGDPKTDKTEAKLRAFGRFVDTLGGRYLTAEDVGTSQDDMDMIRRETPYVTGISPTRGGSGDPSPVTAVGVLEAMRAAAEHRWGNASLDGRHIAIQGVGKVGGHLAELLAKEGARLTVADVNQAAIDRYADELSASVATPASIHATECDVFAPCALGGAIDATTISELRCEVVCGAANNQLADPALETRCPISSPTRAASSTSPTNWRAPTTRSAPRPRSVASIRPPRSCSNKPPPWASRPTRPLATAPRNALLR
jgi:glutamate dehydrogenase/leucine dehydrogenase